MTKVLNIKHKPGKNLLHITEYALRIYKNLCECLEKQLSNDYKITIPELILLFQIYTLCKNSVDSMIQTQDIIDYTQGTLHTILYQLNSLFAKNMINLEAIKQDGKSFNITITENGENLVICSMNLTINLTTKQYLEEFIHTITHYQ